MQTDYGFGSDLGTLVIKDEPVARDTCQTDTVSCRYLGLDIRAIAFLPVEQQRFPRSPNRRSQLRV